MPNMYLYNITRSRIVDVWVDSEADYCGVSKKHEGLFKEWHVWVWQQSAPEKEWWKDKAGKEY